jgi:hypothetical protein
MAKALKCSPVYLSGLQKRFELPVFEGAAYSDWRIGVCALRPDAGGH